jgi:predicted tellurium resistance membrane protein TerC
MLHFVSNEVAALFQVNMIDLVLAGDNAIVIGLAAPGGAAREHLTVLIIGFGLSVALMGIAASYIARLLHRHQSIAYAGIARDLVCRRRDGLPRNGRGLALITHS